MRKEAGGANKRSGLAHHVCIVDQTDRCLSSSGRLKIGSQKRKSAYHKFVGKKKKKNTTLQINTSPPPSQRLMAVPPHVSVTYVLIYSSASNFTCRWHHCNHCYQSSRIYTPTPPTPHGNFVDILSLTVWYIGVMMGCSHLHFLYSRSFTVSQAVWRSGAIFSGSLARTQAAGCSWHFSRSNSTVKDSIDYKSLIWVHSFSFNNIFLNQVTATAPQKGSSLSPLIAGCSVVQPPC